MADSIIPQGPGIRYFTIPNLGIEKIGSRIAIPNWHLQTCYAMPQLEWPAQLYQNPNRCQERRNIAYSQNFLQKGSLNFVSFV